MMWFRATAVGLVLFATPACTTIAPQNNQARQLMAEADMWGFFDERCDCKSTPRPCLFIHGENHEGGSDELQHLPVLFGDMAEHAPCCTSIKYASMDTITNEWTGKKLQKAVCKHALSVGKSSDKTNGVIKDTIIVTHSMSALILAGAVANKECSIDSSTSWVSMSAPMNGTMASNYLQDICTDDDTQAFRKILTLLGRCPVSDAMKSLAYMGGKYSSKELNEAYMAAQKVYREHVSAAMCSESSLGIVSTYQAQYMYLGTKVDHGTNQHDGFVTFESCRGGLPASKFLTKPESPFYLSKCNHADTAFLNGDSLMFSSRKPMQWFQCVL